MTDTTLNLLLPYIVAAQAQKHATHNEALRIIDVLINCAVADRDATSPPAAPDEGRRHIVAAAATGAWAGHSGQIAAFQDGAWTFYPPRAGWLTWVADEGRLVAWDGAAWVDVAPGAFPMLGINATADSTNRLAVRSPAALFDGTGAGHQLKINKATPADTASLVLQSGYAGRAEIGLTGDNDLSMKVSSDGITWRDAMTVDRTTGAITMPATPRRVVLTAARTYHVRTDGADSNDGRGDSPTGAFRTIQKALDTVYGTLDLAGFDVQIAVRAGTYAEALAVRSPQVGAGSITLVGDTATPANVTLDSGGSTGIYVKGAGSKLFVAGLKVRNNGFAGWHADAGGFIQSAGRNEIGAVGAHQIIAEGPSSIFMISPMIISGGCPGAHLYASSGGYIYTQGAVWTMVGTPTFGSFAYATVGGVIYTFANTFSGTINGQRFGATLNGVIQTNSGGNVNHFPGAIAGITSSGGQYA